MALCCACSRPARTSPAVIVLGVDGMDPGFVERHWSALPNLARLRDRGGFRRLATTTPPQSPVAWSTFITGLPPAQHGIFDFVHRDPATLQPYSSMSRTEEPRFSLPLGPYVLPLSSSRVIPLRRGPAFWQPLAQRGIPVSIVRMPTNYPPLSPGLELAGMGVPDLRGTQGTFTFFTDDPGELSRSVSGGEFVKVDLVNGRCLLPLPGPANSLRRDHAPTSADLVVDVDPVNPAARVKLGAHQVVLEQGEWSDWIPVEFSLMRGVASARGMVRLFARQLHPSFELYVSAVNVDPESPALPITSPASLGREIAREAGRYYTMGTPEDTAALRQGVFTLPEFRAQTRLVFEDERKLLRYFLRHYQGGFLFFYFSAVDQNSHMLWGKHEPELLEVYRAVDECAGEVMRAQPAADLIVMSDHGFTSFDTAVHLNAWLRDRGFLTLSGPPRDDATLADIDWSSTEAYAIGLNGLYVNLVGRESHGIVKRGAERDALIASLREQLLAFRNPSGDRPVVASVDEPHAAPENASVAPDLIIGYTPGYRASWQTGIGGVPNGELEPNTEAWIGDHCMNAADLPGVLLATRPIRDAHPRLQDVTASILGLYGIRPATATTGHSVF